jgi:hypothetical protein
MKSITALAPFLAAFVVLVSAGPALADGTSETNPVAILIGIPTCMAGQPGAPISIGEDRTVSVCKVDVIREPAGGWQAAPDEWIVFRTGWTDTLAGCQTFAEGTTTSWTLDGRPTDGLEIPCSPYPPSPGAWQADWLLISPPLSAGIHQFTVMETTPIGCTLGPASGANCTLSRTITIGTSPPTPIPVGIGPICVNGLGVSLNGGVGWGQLPVGTITIDWGDGSSDSGPAVFPAAHRYSASSAATIKVSASSSGHQGSASALVNVGSGAQTCSYSIAPQPIAPAHTLAASMSVNVVITVRDQNGNLLSGAPVWLSLQQSAGGGTAGACCFFVGQSVPTVLNSVPQVLVSGVSQPAGTISVTYSAPAVLPASGSDSVIAQNSPISPTVVLQDGYSFA